MPEFSLAADSAEISNTRSVLPSQRPFTSHLGVAATLRVTILTIGTVNFSTNLSALLYVIQRRKCKSKTYLT